GPSGGLPGPDPRCGRLEVGQDLTSRKPGPWETRSPGAWVGFAARDGASAQMRGGTREGGRLGGLPQRRVISASERVGQALAPGREGQRDRIYAIAEPRRRRAVGEDMPLVAVTAGAARLDPDHAV